MGPMMAFVWSDGLDFCIHVSVHVCPNKEEVIAWVVM